jgi:hypothetical protein
LVEGCVALDASEILGSPQLAGVKVGSRGTGKRLNRGGLALLASAIRDRESSEPDQTPAFGLFGYLAVTDEELAVISLTFGWGPPKIDHVVTRIPRRAVASVELGSPPNAPLTITLSSGDRWELEVPTFYGGRARKVVAALREDTSTDQAAV